MSVIATNIVCLDNPATFNSPFKFEITFECIHPLKEDLEWRLTYVGSADSEEFDQVLDSICVGPISLGQLKFVFETPGADASKIKKEDLLGVTVVLLEGLYKDRIFLRVGYYVSNESMEPLLEEGGAFAQQQQQQQQMMMMSNSPQGRARNEREQNKDDMMEIDLGEEDDDEEEEEEDEEDDEEDMENFVVADEEENIEKNQNMMNIQAIPLPLESKGEKKKQVAPPQTTPAASNPNASASSFLDPSKIKRTILADKPRVTRFPIRWDDDDNVAL